MAHASRFESIGRFSLVLVLVLIAFAWFVMLQTFQAGSGRSVPVATYSEGVLRVTIPYRLEHAGSGQLMIEVLNPENRVLGHLAQHAAVTERRSQWQEEIKLDLPLPVDDLVWQRVHYRFEYDDGKAAAFDGVEAISQILRSEYPGPGQRGFEFNRDFATFTER